MIHLIKFTSLFWHSREKTVVKEDLKTKIPHTPTPSLSEHPLRRPSVTQKQRQAPQRLNGSSLCDPLHLHKGPSSCLSRKRFNGREKEEGVHAVTFTVLKKAYCCSLPKGPALIGFGRTSPSRLLSADKC